MAAEHDTSSAAVPLDGDKTGFAGVWQRTELQEPIGTLLPDGADVLVLWLQAACGLFVDIRIPRSGRSPSRLKSFAGVGTYDAAARHFTWTRHVDYRVPGQPDVGLMNMLAPDTLQEDSVLPGDDYREIWQRIGRAGDSDMAARLQHKTDPNRTGFFIVVGDRWAVALGRSVPSDVADAASYAARVAECFDGGELSDDQRGLLAEYTCAVGETRGPDQRQWPVVHATDDALQGRTLTALADGVLRDWTISSVLQGRCTQFWTV
eukprot:TRINITY_DN23532_c0_g1_i1.p1 TRINITY_DN23532_c0_g1~~TRINITY_DN23532_c0_g1_i1.p1  ORF type:complete len:263 (-),score=71.74 TRINITY_DN23532_c0_g1_i1:142-930(-)